MKRILSENKVLLVLAIIIIVSIVVIAVSLVLYFYTGNGKDEYGDRLQGIEDVQISDDINDKVADLYAENPAFNEVVVNVKGKIIYINIDIKENLSLVDAQSLAIKSKTTEEESEIYPLMGYKNAKNSQVVWTN